MAKKDIRWYGLAHREPNGDVYINTKDVKHFADLLEAANYSKETVDVLYWMAQTAEGIR